ncbi:sulfatase-like hydrolase/transferase, partial [Myxococcota bacterium]|nr:sulfatase-like hydrolase/transferase [Myxococcota bacterium]
TLAGYDAELAYLDLHLGRLLEAIEKGPNAENTWVIITSDHGESFGEHFFLSHGAHLYEDNVRVPLLVRSPGETRTRHVSQPVQNHTIFGSILEAAGLPKPTWAKSLPEGNEGTEIMLEVHRSDSNISFGGEFFDRDLYSIVESPFKLIRSSRDDVELFDLSEDPEELNNLHTSNPEMARHLDKQLNALLNARPPLYPEPENLELSEETRESLRAMGYIE